MGQRLSGGSFGGERATGDRRIALVALVQSVQGRAKESVKGGLASRRPWGADSLAQRVSGAGKPKRAVGSA